MKRLAASAFVVMFGLVGCHRAPAPGPQTHDLFGGKYFVEIEIDGSFTGLIESQKAGDEQTVELAEFKWAGGNKLAIDKGKLTFNGTERGTLNRGDRLRVDRNGRLTVNGQLRE